MWPHYGTVSGMNAALDKWEKDWWTMNSNRLAVFAIFLAQWRGESRVKGNYLVSDVRHKGDLMIGVCSKKVKKMNGGSQQWDINTFWLIGLIGRSHSPAQAQAEERQGRKRLGWGSGNTIFTSSAKKEKQNHREGLDTKG